MSRLSDRERVAAQVPEEAAEVLGSRSTHGEAYKNHKQIADFWSTYLGVDIAAHQVAQMMVLMKVSRQSLGSIERDHYTDQAGYSGIGWACEAYDYLQEYGELPESCDEQASDMLTDEQSQGGNDPDTQVPENTRTYRRDDPALGAVGGTNDDSAHDAADGMTAEQLLRRVARPLASLTSEHIEVEGVRSMSGDTWAFGDDVSVTVLEPKPVEDLAAAMRYAEIEYLALSAPEEIDFDVGKVAHHPIGHGQWKTEIGASQECVHQFSAMSQVSEVKKRETKYVSREDL
jgi:hypothetical protein